MKEFVLILLMCGLAISGCSVKRNLPVAPMLENSIVFDDGSLYISPDDSIELLSYIHELKEGYNGVAY